MGLFSKIGQGLKKTRDAMMSSMNSMLRGFTRIDAELFEELEEILVMGDVGTATASRICEQLRATVKERGITDPTKVTRSALQNASSVASVVLTTESLVADIKEPVAAAPAAPDMGGMY